MNTTPSKTMAALWMAGWLSLMLVMAVAGRETTRELNVFQIMEVRSVIGFTLLLPIIYRSGGFKAVATKRLPQHLARNGVHYFAQLGWFYALTLIGIGQVVAIEFTMPIWTALLAATFLSERMTVWKIAAIVLGIVGVVMIVRPATGEINPGQLQHLHDIGEITDPDRERIVDPILDDRRADGRGSAPDALCLDLAVGLPVGLAVRYRGLRHILALLPRQRAPVRGCDHRGADGLSAGSAHGHRRLAALFRAARLLDRARRGADPLRQSPELEAGFAGSRPRTLNLAPLRATKPSGRVI
jgi:uncharacterized membrane protein